MDLNDILASASVWVPGVMFIASIIFMIGGVLGMITGPPPSWEPERPQTLVGTAYATSSTNRWEDYRRSTWILSCKRCIVVAVLLMAASLALPVLFKYVTGL